MRDKHVVVTGASAGIGAAVARAASAAGAKVTLVARREAALEALAAELPGPAHLIARDLVDLDVSWLAGAEAALGPVDVLVNNAGVQVIGRTHTVDLERAEQSLVLNLMVPLRLIRTLLPHMIERGSGTIVNIASMAALAPTPGMTWYNAGKGGIAAASEALRGELAGTGVDVCTVYPGLITDTDMGRHGMASYGADDNLAIRMQPQGSAPDLASVILRAVDRRHARVIWPRANVLARHFPATTRWAMDTFAPLPVL